MILNHPIMFSISSEIFNVFGNIQQMFSRSDGPDKMFCHRGHSSSDKNHFCELRQLVLSGTAGTTATCLTQKEGGRCFHRQRPLRTECWYWRVVPRVGAWLGRLGALTTHWSHGMGWGLGDTGLDWAGLGWTLNTILNIFSEAHSQSSPARPLLIFHFQH